ncbi:unnamed protein product, partial [Nippostrongylus brasiliensis]|uniref:ABC transporter domain-containing protein n=1 Tax=Nippostrongylus brasiliensis TaxID=27835 RepID=A0A0N4XF01_NIPBR
NSTLQLATEAIEQHKTVQYLTREQFFVDKFVHEMEGPHRRSIIRGVIQSLTYSLSVSFVCFNFACAYRYGIFLVQKRVCSPYTVFQVIESLNTASMSLIAFATYFPEYPLEGNIRFQSLFFSYPVNRRSMVLNGMSLTIPAGKTVALVGPSGCGKSTSIQLIERFYDPVAGKENIAYGMDSATDSQIEDAAKLANAHGFIAKLPAGYDTVVGERGSMLSGGQKQRIAIARAVIRNPKILLLDEATSALDTESERVVQEALERARLGRTCVIIAHRLSSIQNSDTIVVMKDGKVKEQGTHQQLLAMGGLYAGLVSKQDLK